MNNYTRTTLFRMIHRRFLSLFSVSPSCIIAATYTIRKKGNEKDRPCHSVPVIPVYIHFFFLNHQTHRMTMRQEMTIRTG